jgi:hypothetical protein
MSAGGREKGEQATLFREKSQRTHRFLKQLQNTLALICNRVEFWKEDGQIRSRESDEIQAKLGRKSDAPT